jgi:hypothetical protein
MNKRKLFVFLALILSLSLAAVSWAAPAAEVAESSVMTKQIAAPADEIASLALPDPAATGLQSRWAVVPVTLTQNRAGEWTWQSEIPFDSSERLSVMLLSPHADRWQVSVTAPGRTAAVPMDRHDGFRAAYHGAAYQAAQFGLDNNLFPAELLTFEQVAAGEWQVQVTADSHTAAREGIADGYLVLSGDSPYQIYTHLSSHNLVVGQTIGLETFIFTADAAEEQVPQEAAVDLIDAATVRLVLPSGQVETVPMTVNRDGRAVAQFQAGEPGSHTAHVLVEGRTAAGERFVRTSEHAFPVIAPAYQLGNQVVQAHTVDTNRLELALPVTAVSNQIQTGAVLLGAEVWGTNARGEMVPATWIGGITTPVEQRSGLHLPLNLDMRWLALAEVGAPYELRNVRLQDVETQIPFATAATLALDLPRSAESEVARLSVTAVSDDMLMGVAPDLSAEPTPAYVGGNKLMLVHGYCSGGVWPTSHFSNYAVFQDFNQNRSHNQFAQLIGSYGSQFDSFGVVAHSQGGAATLHLYTYYWSGLDWSSGNRLIQSVGTPYQGTSLAGMLALLGEIFGAGCGTNWDLTYDGASLWLSGIPSWARSRVYYHTTAFEWKWWRYDYCSLATDLFLSDPEDGVVERWAGQLSGANNMGHKSGWCHTNSMRDPAQYLDYSRNSNMNANANR